MSTCSDKKNNNKEMQGVNVRENETKLNKHYNYADDISSIFKKMEQKIQ